MHDVLVLSYMASHCESSLGSLEWMWTGTGGCQLAGQAANL